MLKVLEQLKLSYLKKNMVTDIQGKAYANLCTCQLRNLFKQYHY